MKATPQLEFLMKTEKGSGDILVCCPGLQPNEQSLDCPLPMGVFFARRGHHPLVQNGTHLW